jgi:hypothetical protein
MYRHRAVTLALLASQAALAVLIYFTMWPAVGKESAFLFFIAIPLGSVFVCAVLFANASRRGLASTTQEVRPSTAWLPVAVLGLLGLLLALAAGPHLAAFFTLWCPLLQTLAFIIAALAHHKRSASRQDSRVA